MAQQVTVTTPSDRELAVTRVFAAPRGTVYAAWTQPKWLQRWLTGPAGWDFAVCDMDLRPGGLYRWVWRNADGAEMGLRGEFLAVVPEERLVATERWDMAWAGGGEDVVTTTFTETDGATTVTTTVYFQTREQRDGALHSGMTNGMAESYDRLDQLLAEQG